MPNSRSSQDFTAPPRKDKHPNHKQFVPTATPIVPKPADGKLYYGTVSTTTAQAETWANREIRAQLGVYAKQSSDNAGHANAILATLQQTDCVSDIGSQPGVTLSADAAKSLANTMQPTRFGMVGKDQWTTVLDASGATVYGAAWDPSITMATLFDAYCRAVNRDINLGLGGGLTGTGVDVGL